MYIKAPSECTFIAKECGLGGMDVCRLVLPDTEHLRLSKVSYLSVRFLLVNPTAGAFQDLNLFQNFT